MKTRFLLEVGTRARLRIYWGSSRSPGTCKEGNSFHNGTGAVIAESATVGDWGLGGCEDDHPDADWPVACDDCGELAPAHVVGAWHDLDDSAVKRMITRQRLYAASDGTLIAEREMSPGDMFYATWYEYGGASDADLCHHGWTNCTGKHLIVVTPDGHSWDTGGRASNCDQRDNTTHRCWVRHGDPERGEVVHIDKAGETCGAGAGSIQTRAWHGFLHNGELVVC